MSERLAGMIGEQRMRFVENYATEPNRVGIPLYMLPAPPPREIMGMQVRVLDWSGATVTVWCECEDGGLTPRPPLREAKTPVLRTDDGLTGWKPVPTNDTTTADGDRQAGR